MTFEDVTPALLDRYLTGECTPDEVRLVHAALDTDGDIQVVLEQLRELRQSAALDAPWDVPRMWRRMEQVLDEAPVNRSVQPTASPEARLLGRSSIARRVGATHRGRWQPIWYGVASALAASLVLAVGWTWIAQQARHRATPAMVAYATAPGQRATITLPDGSAVLLNVASRLEVPSDYAAGDRMVRLMGGEAMFTVAHQGGAPFTVTTGTTVTRVLGTTFLVRRYPTDTAVTVAVRDGRVTVGGAVLTQGRLAEVGRTGAMHLGTAEPWRFSFAAGVLTLANMPLSQAIPELNRWYDADIRLGDPSLASKPVEGKMTTGSVADLAAVLELTGVRVVRSHRTLTLYPR